MLDDKFNTVKLDLITSSNDIVGGRLECCGPWIQDWTQNP